MPDRGPLLSTTGHLTREESELDVELNSGLQPDLRTVSGAAAMLAASRLRAGTETPRNGFRNLQMFTNRCGVSAAASGVLLGS